MRIECPGCRKLFYVPTDRTPDGETTLLPCPDCKRLIPIAIKNGRSKYPDKESKELKREILRALIHIPPLPQVVFKARETMNDPNAGLKDLAKVIETDQAIVAKILKLANSSYYGLRGKVSSVQHATVLLGKEALWELVVVAGASGLLGRTLKGYGLSAGILWRHSLAVAAGAKSIADRRAPELASEAFTAGLTHDIGKLILDPHIADMLELFQEYMSTYEKNFIQAEKDILGFDHTEIASELFRRWHIPGSLILAVRTHHDPFSSEDNFLGHIIYFADIIAVGCKLGAGLDTTHYKLDKKAMDYLGLEKKDLMPILEEVKLYVEQVSEEILDERLISSG